MPRPSLTLPALALIAVLAVLALPGGALAAREIPVGITNVNDQNLRDPSWLYAIRFVVDRDTTLYRFISAFKAKGASWDENAGPKCSGPGAGCYGAGNGGTINARLVPIRADGTPDLSHVLAEETVGAQQRYFETKAAYGLSTVTLAWYFNMGGAQIEGGRPYAMVYRNVAADPGHNFSSVNSPTIRASAAGPNGRNNLDPDAHGAVAGLDPREAVAWSTNGGGSWTWGREVGPYYGSATSDDGTRLPHYGWQSSPLAAPESNQPYYNYWSTCSPCTLVARSVPRRTVLTEGGGYAPQGSSLGVVTVRNTRTGETGRTGSLGDGLVRGALDHPVTVEVGDTYQVSSTGTAYRAEADAFLVGIFGLGSGAFPFTTNGYGADRAEVFALPHPYFAPPADPEPPAEPPASDPPASDPPASDPPPSDPPPSDPPAGDPPPSDPPASDPPAGDPPAGDPPAGDHPAGDPPSSEPPPAPPSRTAPPPGTVTLVAPPPGVRALRAAPKPKPKPKPKRRCRRPARGRRRGARRHLRSKRCSARKRGHPTRARTSRPK
jgi:hypothetical protein